MNENMKADETNASKGGGHAKYRQWRDRIGGNEFRVMRLSDAPATDAKLSTPQAIDDYLRPRLAESVTYRPDVENLVVVLLSARLQPIGFEVVSNGTLDTLLVHPREVFKAAILGNAAAIVVAHNHPSGDPSPSEADVKVTRDLWRAGQLLKIALHDHVVLGSPGRRASLRDMGYLNGL